MQNKSLNIPSTVFSSNKSGSGDGLGFGRSLNMGYKIRPMTVKFTWEARDVSRGRDLEKERPTPFVGGAWL